MYTVETYDAEEGPSPETNINYGQFQSFTSALFCAIQIIDRFFTKELCKNKDPKKQYELFRDHGEIPIIKGPLEIDFNIKEYVHLKLGLTYARKKYLND